MEIPYKIFDSWEKIIHFHEIGQSIFKSLYEASLDIKVHFFQYKLIYKYLNVKKMLYIWGIETSPYCCFCFEEEETIDHLFWYCSPTALFWLEVQSWLLKCDIHRFKIRSVHSTSG